MTKLMAVTAVSGIHCTDGAKDCSETSLLRTLAPAALEPHAVPATFTPHAETLLTQIEINKSKAAHCVWVAVRFHCTVAVSPLANVLVKSLQPN